MKKLYQITMTLIFFLIISSFSIYYIIFMPKRTYSQLEARTFTQFTLPTLESVASGQFQDNFEKAFSDQVPQRDRLLLLTAKLNTAISRLAYTTAPGIGYPLSKETNSPYLYSIEGNQVIIAPPEQYLSHENNSIKEELNAYGRLMDELPNTRFFAAIIEPLPYLEIHPLVPYYDNPVNGRYLKTFIENAPADMGIAVLEAKTMEEYQQYFYKTDHHWKGPGVLKLYDDLYTLISEGIPDFPPKLGIKGVKELKHIAFRGSLARRGLYEDLYEHLSYVDAEGIELVSYVNDKPAARSNKSGILSGSPNLGTFANVYGEYFGNDFAIVSYENKKTNNRNLLIVGPSYTQAIEYLLASHYSKTHVIDLRHYKNLMGEDFNIKEYIRENSIDDVIFINKSQSFSDPVWQPQK